MLCITQVHRNLGSRLFYFYGDGCDEECPENCNFAKWMITVDQETLKEDRNLTITCAECEYFDILTRNKLIVNILYSNKTNPKNSGFLNFF